ncbi:MAG TPA: hypothetical protein VJ915_04555, partial [Balneolaceae bacterium]|nr:hypothetical protein [Balneolaceae bacterium]
NQDAPIDIFGVGTRLVTGHDSPALDGVYKLSSVGDQPKIKVSENVEKITLPGSKQVHRFLDDDGNYYCDAISLYDEDNVQKIHHPTFPSKDTDLSSRESYPLIKEVIRNGEQVGAAESISDSAAYCKKSLGKLSGEFKRFENPHIFKVGITPKLLKLRDQLLDQNEY